MGNYNGTSTATPDPKDGTVEKGFDVTRPYTVWQSEECISTESLKGPIMAVNSNWKRDLLLDLSAVKDVMLNGDEVQSRSRYFADKIHADTRVAVAAGEDIAYGFSRMFELIVSACNPRIDIRVFRKRVEAETWLESAEIKTV